MRTKRDRTTDRSEEILAYWFEGADESVAIGRDHPTYKRWFGGGSDVDRHITAEFAADVATARAGNYDAWRATARGSIALVLLLDQFPRHIFRADGRAFDSDATALAIAQDCVASRLDETLSVFERLFLYLPFQHSEDLAHHEVAHERFGSLLTLAREKYPALRNLFEAGMVSEQEHADTLRAYGRYPYRNAALNRQSTAEELAYLAARAKPQ